MNESDDLDADLSDFTKSMARVKDISLIISDGIHEACKSVPEEDYTAFILNTSIITAAAMHVLAVLKTSRIEQDKWKDNIEYLVDIFKMHILTDFEMYREDSNVDMLKEIH